MGLLPANGEAIVHSEQIVCPKQRAKAEPLLQKLFNPEY